MHMAKNKNTASNMVAGVKQTRVVNEATPTPQPVASNRTLTYRKNHPGNRVSYGIAGVPGIVVFDLKLFADGKAPVTIVLDCALALPVAKPAKTVAA
jgi:hypothetical protein